MSSCLLLLHVRLSELCNGYFSDVLLQCQKINEDASAAIDSATQALWNT